jgi:hypothetical protein
MDAIISVDAGQYSVFFNAAVYWSMTLLLIPERGVVCSR